MKRIISFEENSENGRNLLAFVAKLSSVKVAKACSLLREVLIANHQKNKKIFESA